MLSDGLAAEPIETPMDSLSRGTANLLLLADILDSADALHRATGKPAYSQRDHAHDCGAPACALSYWYAYKGSTWLDGQIDEVLAEFGLTPAEGIELFSGRGCGEARTAREAAAYIRGFVARRGGRASDAGRPAD